MKFFKFLSSKTFLIQLAIALVISVILLFGVIKFLSSYTNQTQRIEVPNLQGLTLDEVKIVLEDIKLKYEIQDYGAYNPNIARESVLSQQPLSGDIVKENRKIYIVINPKGYAKTAVPKFYGKTDKEIKRLLKSSGFKLGVFDSIDDIGMVVRKLKHKNKELQKGDLLPKYSVIDVVIGNGKLNN